MDRSRFTVNCSILFTELPLLDRPRAAADAGFSAVEFWWPFALAAPEQQDVDAFVAAVRAAGVALSSLNFFAGDIASGERGILSAPGRGEEFHANVAVLGRVAEALDCHLFNVLYGNRLNSESPDAQDAVAAERLAALAEFTAATASTLLLEPLSGIASYPLTRGDDALDVVQNLKASGSTTSVKVLADLYHLAANGEDVFSSIARLGDEIGHVQIADAPGRGAPGTGEQPVAEWLAALDATGYTGRIGLEYRPTVPSADSFAWIDALG